MNPLTVILTFGSIAFVALALYLVQDFAGPLVIGVAVVVLLLILLRR